MRSELTLFSEVDWTLAPEQPGVYVIRDRDEVIDVGRPRAKSRVWVVGEPNGQANTLVSGTN